ncbi:hypothetical protein B296_00028847 [Ensete ventricosum]|uniref:Uncharacterized protein n=1 Tax=Ensete ventricosum TaxID=4639 RepID=A0A427AM41_ENSVE|nr:hypothetical protein B296_00028847 [Ensete ventricosum]
MASRAMSRSLIVDPSAGLKERCSVCLVCWFASSLPRLLRLLLYSNPSLVDIPRRKNERKQRASVRDAAERTFRYHFFPQDRCCHRHGESLPQPHRRWLPQDRNCIHSTPSFLPFPSPSITFFFSLPHRLHRSPPPRLPWRKPTIAWIKVVPSPYLRFNSLLPYYLPSHPFSDLEFGSISKGKLEAALKKMCKEGVYWGKLNKNATLGGAISGLLISAASNNGRDKVIKDAITAGAVATAAEFINYFT